jgi:putative membrane protein
VKNRTSSAIALVLCSASYFASGCGGAPSTSSPTAATSPTQLSDGEILAIYNQTNTFDIETGQLGDARGATKDVRALGRMVVADHTAVRDKASQLGMKLGIAPVLPPERASATMDHDGKMSELRGLSGADFDRAYLHHEIQFHTDAIAAVRTVLIPATANAELKQLMTDILPGFQHHLDETVRIAKKLGYQ